MMKSMNNKDEFERFLRSEVGEPLTCPILNSPYLLLAEELIKQQNAPILLADPKAHPDRTRFAVAPLPDPVKEVEKFIVTSLPLPKEIQQRFAQFRRKALSMSCQSNLRNIGLALAMYIQDYDDRFPPMKTSAETRKALLPYLRDVKVFTCPATKKPYLPNPNLHLKHMDEITNPNEVPAFYDAQIHPDGTCGVVFVDGHAKLLPLKEWQAIQKRYKLPTKAVQPKR